MQDVVKDKYKALAQDCSSRADCIEEAEDKAKWLKLAAGWQALADSNTHRPEN